MTTKDPRLFFKNKREFSGGNAVNGQYNTLNLNHNNHWSSGDSVSNTINIETNYHQKASNTGIMNTAVNDLKESQKRNDVVKWKNMHQQLTPNMCQQASEQRKVNREKERNGVTKNISTLSLHISAYENSIEVCPSAAAAADSNGEKESTKKENSLSKEWKNVKQVLATPSSAGVRNSFEFPRQQKDQFVTDPEVMQFKASQKLLNPTEGNSATTTTSDTEKADIHQSYNASNVVKKLIQGFPLRNSTSHITSFESELASRIKDLLLHPDKCFDDLCFEINGYDDVEPSSEEESSSEAEETDPTYVLADDPKDFQLLEDKYSEEKWQEIIENNRKWEWPHLQHMYKKLRNRNEITRMESYLQKGGSRIKKLRLLDEMVLKEFIDWKEDLQIVHDRDLVDAALAAADILGLLNFEASEPYIRRFKKRHHIVSRKITNFRTQRDLVFENDLMESMESFREKFRRVVSKTSLSNIYNSDQTGIQMEMISKRTLADEGVKKVSAMVQKLDALTHSFTVQPVISADGKLQFPVFVTFHEPNKPNIFEDQLEPFRYIRATSSKSGKMTSTLAKTWFEEVFKPHVEQKSHLVVDSWTGYNQAFQNESDITIHILPKKSTGELQPLDVFFNRQLKAFYRTLSDKIRRRHNDFNVSNRKGIATLLQLTLCQMASKEFTNMISYAWFKSGLIQTQPPPFLTPVQYCFDLLTSKSYCHMESCSDRAFIACANCEHYLCFNHYVNQLHDCTDFLKNE